MQRITLITVGSIKTPALSDLCSDYTHRLSRSVEFEVIEVPASKEREADRQSKEECEKILKALENHDGDVWVLDERGSEFTSEGFSEELLKARDAGRSVIFVLGGAYGLSDKVRAKGKLFALSKMTFPHELCRLVFLEQLYRAEQIAKGTGYHH